MTRRDVSGFKEVSIIPLARWQDIVVQETGEETLIYDAKTAKAHHLNETVYFVWKQCDGKSRVDDVARRLSEKFGSEIDSDFVWLAIDELSKVGLVETKIFHDRISRRKALLRYALPAIVLPAVVSLVAPQTVDAQSCLGVGQTDCCVTPCCPGLVCANAVGVVCPGICVVI